LRTWCSLANRQIKSARRHRAESATWLNGVKEYFLSFDQFTLEPHITAAVKAAGYTEPTPIQEQAIPVVLQGRDVMGVAQTGTGKTAAFLLPIIQRLAAGPRRRVRALVLAPTRELAEQIHQAATGFSRNSRLRSASVYGGVSKFRQEMNLRRGAEIVVACPGRLLDHIDDRTIDLSGVEVLVLDEADRMCDMGFLPDIRRILGQLPQKRQTLFFSATMPREIRSLADSILRDPVSIQVGDMAPIGTVSHALYPVTEALKPKMLLTVLSQTATGRVLIFTRTKHKAQSLATTLVDNGYRVSALQGNMTQNRRQAAINGFKSGRYDILVATDIAARGIDVSQISHVINFDVPDSAEAYTHRIGRTGRARQTGEAYTFASRADAGIIHDIEKVLGASIERRKLDGFDCGDIFSVKRPPAYSSDSRRRRPQPGRNRRSYSSGNSGFGRGMRPAAGSGTNRRTSQAI
jgi:ATP-dependent RNA helicase RhlE